MLIHCYLKCIEFPWKMIHSCRFKLINNNHRPGLTFGILTRLLSIAMHVRRLHGLPCAAALTAHLEKKEWL